MKTKTSFLLAASFDEKSDELYKKPTNYFRAIAYELDHAIRHLALIKIGIKEVSNTQLADGYDIALSTIKYRKDTAGL